MDRSTRNQSPIFSKSTDFLVWLLDHTEKFPKSERFRLAKRLEDSAFAFHELLLQAYPNKAKRRYFLMQADQELEKLRLYMRLAYLRKHTNLDQYRFASQKLVELGKLLGGWLKVSPSYQEVFTLALVLLLFSSLSGRASPTELADVYLDSRFPGLDHTLATGAFLMLAVGLVAYPIYQLMSRLDAEKKMFVRVLLPSPPPMVRRPVGKSESEMVRSLRRMQGVVDEKLELSFSIKKEKSENTKTLFFIEGPRNSLFPSFSKIGMPIERIEALNS